MGRVRTSHKESLLSKIGKRSGLIGLIGIPALVQAYTISGNLKDIHTNEPIDNAKVKVYDFNDPSNVDSTFTDSMGNYTIDFSGTGIEEEDKRKNIDVINKHTGLDLLVDKEINGGIYDALGRRVKSFKGNNRIYISTKGLKSGNYFIAIPNYKSFKFTVADGGVLGLGNKEIENMNEENTNFLIKKPYDTKGKNSMKGSLDSLGFIFTHPEHWIRDSYRAINSDTIINESMISNDSSFFNMDFYNEICQRGIYVGSQKWVMDTIQYMIDTSNMPGAMKDTIVSIINDEVIFMTEGKITPIINFTDTHSVGWPDAGHIEVYVDNSIPGQGAHAEKSIPGHDNNDYTLETALVELKNYAGRGVILQELLQNYGWKNDSNLEPSIFNDPLSYKYLQKADSLSRILYIRPPRNMHPDEDHWDFYF